MSELARRAGLISELGKVFLKTNALRIGEYTKSDGSKTPFYISLTDIMSFPNAFSLAVDCMNFKLDEFQTGDQVQSFCGIPVVGLVLGAVIAHERSKPILYPHREPTHKIAGILKPGTHVLIIDDVSETGVSIEQAAHSIRANGGVVEKALTLIDRGEGAAEALQKMGIELESFTTLKELASTLKENLALSEEEAEFVGSG